MGESPSTRYARPGPHSPRGQRQTEVAVGHEQARAGGRVEWCRAGVSASIETHQGRGRARPPQTLRAAGANARNGLRGHTTEIGAKIRPCKPLLTYLHVVGRFTRAKWPIASKQHR